MRTAPDEVQLDLNLSVVGPEVRREAAQPGDTDFRPVGQGSPIEFDVLLDAQISQQPLFRLVYFPPPVPDGGAAAAGSVAIEGVVWHEL